MKTNLGDALLTRCARLSRDDSVLFATTTRQVTVAGFRALAHASGAFWRATIQPGERVVIAKADSIEHNVCYLGVLLAGGVPASVNPLGKTDTLRAIVGDCGARHVVCEDELDDEIGGRHAPRLWSASLDDSCRRENVVMPPGRDGAGDPVLADEQALAFLQYTSGTTGRPKGVMHSARGLLAVCEAFAHAHLGLGPHDCIYSVAKVFFAYGAGNSLFFPLHCGARAFLDGSRQTIDTIARNLADVRPSVFCAVPTVFRWLASADLPPSAQEAMGGLRLAISAGGPLPADVFASFRRRFGRSIIDGFGATEMAHIFIANHRDASRTVLARTLPGFSTTLVPSEQLPQADGGELIVRGPSLALGYYQDAVTTARKFCAEGYRTGDLFRREPDGALVYLGRTDDSFKVKGKWVVPAPLEQSLAGEFPEILDAAVVGVEVQGEPAAVLFIQLAQPVISTGALCRRVAAYCAEHWDSHERPISITEIAEMPKNANGKRIRSPLIARWYEEASSERALAP